MKILIACEESQTVCKAFRELGFEAYSCDILDCSGGHPEWHIKGNVLEIIKCDYIITMTDTVHRIGKWDLMIAHPPCTYLSVSGLHWNKKDKTRDKKTSDALEFVQKLLDAPIKHIALENPVSCISSKIRKPDQTLQPYEHGHPESKLTCIWLKNLPKLHWTDLYWLGGWTAYRCKCGNVFPVKYGKYGCCGVGVSRI